MEKNRCVPSAIGRLNPKKSPESAEPGIALLILRHKAIYVEKFMFFHNAKGKITMIFAQPSRIKKPRNQNSGKPYYKNNARARLKT